MSSLFNVSFLGFCLGVFISSVFNFNFFLSLVCLIGSITFVFYLFLFGKSFFDIRDKNKIYKKIFLFSILILCLSLGSLRYNSSIFFGKDQKLDVLIGERVILDGIIVSEPDERENYTNLIIKFENIKWSSKFESQKVTSKGIIKTDIFPRFNYGDKVSLTGILNKPENFKAEDGELFDYVSYLSKDGIFYEMYKPKITLVSFHQGSFIKEKLFSFKNSFIEKINKIIPEPESSLLNGLIFGEKRSLGKTWEENFKKAGVSHIVVLSGYNITVVAEFIMKATSFIPQNFSLVLGSLSVVLFGIMTGGSSTIVRASLMALIVILARSIKRPFNATRALFFAGLVMILFNPKILVFDYSFELSFLATLGLINLSPLIENKFYFITEKFGLRSIVSSTIATQIFVLPLILYKMGETSLVSLPSNLLMLSFIPSVMFLGFFSGVVCFGSLFLSKIFGFLAFILLKYELFVVTIFSSFNFSLIKTGKISAFLMFVCYIALFSFIYLNKTKREKNG